MKRSEINKAYTDAQNFFIKNGWHLPPNAKWDVTDFGLGEFTQFGLVLVNLCEEVEYCEKLMYARKNMTTPAHYHKKKKEDIICRTGEFCIHLWDDKLSDKSSQIKVKINNEWMSFDSNTQVIIKAGERITLFQGINHAFWPTTDECIIGEVSTANDDLNDNFFDNLNIGRYPHVEEDEAASVKLLSDK